jgi:hypothetical protein
MNENLKTLAKQAEDWYYLVHRMETPGSVLINECMELQIQEKFAELIVQECAIVADAPDVDMLRVGDAVKHHFGVK